MAYVTVPLPILPRLPPSVIHASPVAAVHAHESPAVTAMLPAPPAIANVSRAGAMAYVHDVAAASLLTVPPRSTT